MSRPSSRSHAASGRTCATKSSSASAVPWPPRSETPMTDTTITVVAPSGAPEFTLDALERRARAAQKRRHTLVLVLRFLIFFAIVGAWEASAALGWIDPFFFGRPSGIAQQVVE